MADESETRAALEAENAKLKALLEQADKVIAPFADASEDLDPDHNESDIWEAPCALNIKGKHLRAARQFQEARNHG